MNTENTNAAEKRKLTDTQLRVVQFVLGVLSAAALLAAIWLPGRLGVEPGDLLNYVFVVVFLVIMFGRRSVENKYRLRLGLFSLALMLGVMVGILVMVLTLLYPENTLNWSEQARIMVTAGLVLVLAAAIIVPLIRYFKRKAAGTLPPIRLPEPKEPEKKETTDDAAVEDEDYDGPMTLEQKIAAMTRELDGNKPQDKE